MSSWHLCGKLTYGNAYSSCCHLFSLLSLYALLPAPISSGITLDPNQISQLVGVGLELWIVYSGTETLTLQELVRIIAMTRDQPSAGWGLHHWCFVGVIPCHLSSGAVGLFRAGGAAGGLTSCLWIQPQEKGKAPCRNSLWCVQGRTSAGVNEVLPVVLAEALAQGAQCTVMYWKGARQSSPHQLHMSGFGQPLVL